MRSKRLVSLMMALIVVLTLFAPTLAWAAEGDGGDEIPTESTSAVSESEETAPPEETQPVETDPEPVADPESVADSEPEHATDPEPVAEPAPAAEPVSEPEPEATPTVEPEANASSQKAPGAPVAQITGAGEDMILISFTFNGEEVYSVKIAPGTSLSDSVFSAAEDVVRSYGVQDGKHIVWYLQQDQDNVFDRSAPLYVSDTLIACWVADASGEEQTLSVTFNANGGYFQEDQTKTIWVSEFLVGDRFSPRALADEGILHNANTSLVFDGWYLDADGTEPIPLNGEGLFQPTESITVYAKWILNTVTFTVYANNDNSTPYQEESDEYSAGTTIGIWGCPFTYAGHSFTGWNTEPDGTGTAYMVNEQVTLEGDLTLYAQWEEEQITSGTCGDDLTWSFDPTTGILTVSGTGAMYAYDEVNSPAWMAFRMLIESVVLSNDITSVGTYAFYNCGNLTSACLPCSASIRTGAFQGTNLVSLHLTPGTGEMQYMQIEMISLNCKETLENLILDQGIKNIASCAFKDCAKLKTVVLPEGLESIDGSNAFSGALESITIPDSLMTIGSRAFWVCSSLRDVYYSGTQQLRDQIISIGSENDYLLNATWHYYEAESISVTTPPTKLSYWVGEPLDVSGGELTVDYGIRNGTAYVEQTALTVDMVSGFDSTVIGTQTLTVTYEGKTTTFEVEVVAKTLDHIAVTTLPTKTEYLEGKDALDVTGGKVTLYYDNDTSEVIDLTADIVSGFDNTVIGPQTLTVTYEGKTAAFEVEIISKTLDHIAVTTTPTKTKYLEGKDALDVTGGKLTLYYNNDTADEIDLTADMVSGFDNTVIGPQTLTVTIEEKTTTFEVEIVAKTLDHIEITTLPTKTEYLEGKDDLDVTGGKVTLYYDNVTSEVIDLTAEAVEGFNNKSIGRQTLTVTYEGKTATFEVEIISKSLDHIAMTMLPTKTEYLEGKDELDVTGGRVTLYYNNDTADEIDLTADMVSGFDNTVIGPQTLTVTIGEKATAFTVEIVAKTLDHIAVTTTPAKTEYLEGKDELDVTGGRVTLYYNNDTADEIDLTADMVAGFDNTVIGPQTLTVTFEEKTATFEVEIISKTLDHIAVTTTPTKTKYLEGKDALDVTGGKVTLYYDNDTSEVIDLTADMVSGFDNTVVGAETLTVTFEEKTATFEVEVVAKTLDHIAVTTLPTKTEYLEGKDALDVTGGRVTLYYNNDTADEIDLTADMVSGFDNTVIGPQTLTVTFEEKTATFEVEVVAKTLDHIAVTTLPTKTEYLEGKDELDVTGGRVTLYYNNDTADEINLTADMVSGFDNTVIGPQTLTVTIGEKATAFTVEIVAKTLDHIAVTTTPAKTEYLEGKDELDVTGGKLTLYYNNGTADEIDLTADMVSGFDNTVIGPQTLTVTFEEKTATFEVEVVAKTLDHIAVTTMPVKTEYLEGKDALDVTGGKLTLYYNNDTADEIDLTADMVSDFDNTVVGTKTLTVTYEGKTATFEVEIISKSLDHIAITTLPTKTEYLEGKDELDVTGGKLTLYYNNGTADEIDMTADMVSGFDNTVVGTKTLTVTYEGKTATFEVEIQPRTYIVTLDANGGSCTQSNITVTYKKTYGTLPVPTRNDFTFMGWWTTKDSGGKQVTATTVCYASGNYTLYARWAKSFTVILNPNGGACDTANMTVTYGKAYGTLPTPTKAGYSFAGWWTQMSEGGVQIVSSDVCQATENFTLYARWTPKTYTVTLNPNGGSVSPTTKTVAYGQAYGTLPTPTRSGYIFDGWWTTKDSGGKQVKADTVCYASGNYTLYARWSQGATVSFNPNGGTCSTGSKTVTYGQAYGTMPVPTRKGYTFAGWWTAKDAGGKKVTASTICYATGNYTLYARWTEGYTMTFDPNGGAVSPTTKVVQYGQPYGTLPTPTKAGYTFTGWWTTKAEGGKKVVSTTVCYASAGYTLYARWTAKKFVVTLNPNGGECATATKTVTYGQAYGTMPVPSPRTGYTFAGWYTAKTSGKKVTATTVCYATGNYTLYARWTPKTYTVTFNPNGGSYTKSSMTVTYGKQYGALPEPSRTGYTFAGWWTTRDSGGKQVFSSTVCYATGSYTLYARWKKN